MGTITDFFVNIIKDIPLTDLLREQLLIAKTRIAEIETENTSLKKENADLLQRTSELIKEIKTLKRTKEEFIESRGALFKRKAGGGYHEAVFCIKCRMPLSSFGGDFPYMCDNCNIPLDFSLKDLPDILKELHDS